jgi:lipid-binding SYLF domain-containing protein
MKLKTSLTLVTIATLTCSSPSYAGPLGEALGAVGDAVGYVGETVGDTASAVGKNVKNTAQELTGKDDPVAKRRQIDKVAAATLATILRSSKGAEALFDQAYGYAVFDSSKTSFLITTGRGIGVAVRKGDGERTYMHVASAGVNLGAGIQFYRGLFLFETREAFDRFVNQGWQADAGAGATLGKATLEAQAKFTNGMAYYQLSETGIILDATLTGTKYWKSDELNSVR